MPLVNIENRSHTHKNAYRVDLGKATQLLGPDAKLPRDPSVPVKHTSSRVAIVGGGFGGIGSAMMLKDKLKEDDFVLFEKHDTFGGTWYANTYPGCASDIPALWYSFSNELNTNWSRTQPPQYEIEEYLLEVVRKHDLRRHAQFQQAVSEIRYNDDEGTWTLEVVDVNTGAVTLHTSKIVLMCMGGLVYPNQLDAKGIETFKGTYMHSALYDHSVSLKGKKVVVVGNGCSATQLIPVLLKDYGPQKVTQITRSKQHIMPPIPDKLQILYRIMGLTKFTLHLLRWIVVSIGEGRFPIFKGEGIISRLFRWYTARQSLSYMKKNCPPEYQSKVIPDFKVGCKRLIFDHDYLQSLHNPKMDLVSQRIDHITEHSIVLADGSEVEADVIIACTGYDLRRTFSSMKVIGRNKTDIQQVWKDQGVGAYRTILLRDCPNLFTIAGPNSATGHSSVVMAVENGLTFASKICRNILNGRYKSVVVKTKKYDEWFDEVQREHAKGVFGTAFGGCQSWYTQNGVNFTTYPYSQINYWWSMIRPRWQDFEIE